MVSCSGNDAIYMPINYIDALNVNVYTAKETYLPDVRNNNGWLSNITVRYSGTSASSVTVVYLNTDGDYVEGNKDECFLYQNQSCTVTPPTNFEGSAIIDGSDDLSVVVYTDGGARGALDNAFLPKESGDSRFEQATSELWVPAFYKNAWNVNSSVSILNVHDEVTTVSVAFVGRTGYSNYLYTTASIQPGERVTIDGSAISAGSWVGSLKLTTSSSEHRIVARVYDDRATSPAYGRSYNASGVSTGLVYVPAAYRNAWGYNTGLVVQNESGTATNVTLSFCTRTVTNPASCPTTTLYNLAPLQAQAVSLTALSFLPDGWTGSVKLQSSNGMPIAVAVTNSNNVGGYNYTATSYAGRTVYLPHAAKDAGGISTGYTLRNVSGGNIDVQTYYYSQNANLTSTDTFTMASAQVKGMAQLQNGSLPTGWQGSIVLQSTGDIVVMMRADSSDAVSAYNGIVR